MYMWYPLAQKMSEFLLLRLPLNTIMMHMSQPLCLKADG